jgi:5-(carboxyamino)imidazole ribonucleotide synthase
MADSPVEPIAPPATIGILGGGQLGRMLGMAARSMGYRVAVLDPDPACPAAAIADRVEVARYDDTPAAIRLAQGCAVVTYELEHVAAPLVEAIARLIPVRPGLTPLTATQDRVAERRFVVAQGVAVAPWREVVVGDDEALRDAVQELGTPLRVKAAFGGYDGRSQVQLTAAGQVRDAWAVLGRPAGELVLVEQELEFESELSVVCARAAAGDVVAYPPAGNRHVDGVLVESVLPAPVPSAVVAAAQAIARTLADAMGMVGVLTVELFLLAGDRLLVNELAPRVHNSGHATIEAAATSQFEQHIRAICGLPLGAPDLLSPAAMVNLLGSGRRRPARPIGVESVLAEPGTHLHLYDKAEAFRGRKLGHITSLGSTPVEALGRARAAARRLHWADDAADPAHGPESAS